ncbi:TraX family protein [Paenibacillus jiagnxiensis]|uniref:TraX family protein n=1 Tax=Paenibacillus jiagnxiensis TaxID=3228926 RepID=UPI0033A269F7
MVKFIAIFTMLLAHIGYLYFPDSTFLGVIGRFAFPLFAWGITVGFRNSKNHTKYMVRVLVLAIVSQYPYFLVFEHSYLNVCFTLFAGMVILKLYTSSLNKWFKLVNIVLIFIIADICSFEYGMYGLATILVFYIYRLKPISILPHIGITLMGIYFYKYSLIQMYSLFSILILMLLHKYDFKINRWVSYAFYPLHLILFVLLDYFNIVSPISLFR